MSADVEEESVPNFVNEPILKNTNANQHEEFQLAFSDGARNANEFFEDTLPTLPRSFKSLIGRPIAMQSEEPREIIKLLGDCLGITNYKENMAPFWFLDTLALQLLNSKHDLDDHYRSVLISWLAGEMQLIIDRKLCRESFFQELKDIFNKASHVISEGRELLYWNEIIHRNLDEETQVEKEENSWKSDVSATPRSGKSGPKKSRARGGSKEPLAPKEEEIKNISIQENEIISNTESSNIPSSINPMFALGVVIDSTYKMYANELRYTLIYSVFVEPIEIENYHLPFLLRTPRPMKPGKSEVEPFETQLDKKLKITESNKKLKDKKANGKERSHLEVIPTPPSSLSEEELLIEKRRFILPLMESEEAAAIIEKHKMEQRQ